MALGLTQVRLRLAARSQLVSRPLSAAQLGYSCGETLEYPRDQYGVSVLACLKLCISDLRERHLTRITTFTTSAHRPSQVV
jgi:hypothetical protein